MTIRINKYLLASILLFLGGVFIYIYRTYDPQEYALFPKCPVKSLTGFDCPGCGSQRAIHAILHGNFKAAFAFNPFFFFAVPYLFLNLYFITRPSLTAQQFKWRNRLYGYRAMILLSISIIVFTILRNIL
ncbi:DUF2752 domain-containing protein [Sphingobacterium spiritivorum]|uniref:DUF2752 domain-containing protein n=1 Tax=Sphingobacterium spiritivorum TaxID=258 RepID=UPI003DA3F1CB